MAKMMDAKTKFANIELALNTAKIAHAEIQFPITHNPLLGNAFTDSNGVQFGFTQIGIGYFYNHLKQFDVKYATLTAMVRNGLFSNIPDFLNPMLGNRKFIASFFMGNIVGANIKYNEIPHKDIISDIQTAGLADLLYSYEINEQAMKLYIADKAILTDEQGNDILDTFTGMVVINGHSGHKALSFRSYFTRGKYKYISEQISSGKARHLSNAIPVYQKMAETFNIVREFALTERLKTISIQRVFAQVIDKMELSTRQEAIVMDVENEVSLKNALDVVMYLSDQLELMKKSGIEAICDAICTYAFNLGGYQLKDGKFVSFP